MPQEREREMERESEREREGRGGERASNRCGRRLRLSMREAAGVRPGRFCLASAVAPAPNSTEQSGWFHAGFVHPTCRSTRKFFLEFTCVP